MKSFLISVLLLGFIGCSQVADRRIASVDRPPQFVLLAFDGSKSLPMWQETMAFADQAGVKFTYFISGVYFLDRAHKRNYVEPLRGRGRSAIGWGKGEMDISQRFRALRDAMGKGHEIASHANGHFDGSGFSAAQWRSELDQFDRFLTEGVRTFDVRRMPENWERTFLSGRIGFRAPLLGYNNSLNPVLAQKNYAYDTSRVYKMNYWPQVIDGVWNFPLAGLRMARTGKRTLSMDYNFYYGDSKGERGDAQNFQFYEDQMFETYMNYFANNYFGNRAPIDIGHHFSKWNGGAYWRAMKRFALAVCGQPEVLCVTYSDLVEFLESAGGNRIASYQEGLFPKMSRASVNIPSLPQRASYKAEELSDSEIEELRQELKNLKHGEEVHQDIEI